MEADTKILQMEEKFELEKQKLALEIELLQQRQAPSHIFKEEKRASKALN